MKQSELRKGNFVLDYEGTVRQIESIYIDDQPCGLFPMVSYGNVSSDVGFVRPVKLDESWLMRLGFTEREDWPSRAGYTMAHASGYKVDIFRNEFIFTPSERKKEGYRVGYVHELQNLFNELLERDYHETL